LLVKLFDWTTPSSCKAPAWTSFECFTPQGEKHMALCSVPDEWKHVCTEQNKGEVFVPNSYSFVPGISVI
jgi:hypothetical protein